MVSSALNFDEDPEEVHESNESLTSLYNALTNHHFTTTYDNPFTLRTTTDTPYVSHSDDEGLSSDEVGRFLSSEITPWGIDWIGLSFPVRNIAMDPPFPWIELHSNGGKWTHIWKTSFEIGQGIVDLKITKNWNSLSGYLEFNPTTCMYGPKTIYVTRFDDVLEVLNYVLDAVDEWVTPGCTRSEMYLSRLDVNVTVEPVSDIQRVLSMANNAPTHCSIAKEAYRKDGSLQSVIRRSKRSGGFCIYDKGLQAGLDKAAIRFEVLARRSRLRDICSTLGELREEHLRVIALKSLQPVIDTLSLAPRNAVSDIFAIRQEKTAFIEMVGLATLADLGHHPKVSSYALRKKYKPILKKYSARTVGDLLN